ncbi:hypothetical protein [Corynebacterium sp. AOP12-C2-36]|uniref:hypothetical protein n=1 Tax=Corynebacterium sp. AOP12-C2-36 TaxID=3457723 RepID=UPI004033DB44
MTSSSTNHVGNSTPKPGYSPWLIAVTSALWLIAAALIVALILLLVDGGGTNRAADPSAMKQAEHASGSASQSVDSEVLTSPIPPWPRGARILIHSRDPEVSVVSGCSVAFSFTAETGLGYALTAAHCGAVGDTVTDTDHTEVGSIVANGMPDSDWALVEITDPGSVTTSANLPTDVVPVTPPMSLLVDPLSVGREVLLRGATSQVESGMVLPTEGERGEGEDRVMPSSACARSGDSGGAAIVRTQPGTLPVAEVTVGVISTRTGECAGDVEPENPDQPLQGPAGSGISPVDGFVSRLDELAPGGLLMVETVAL